MTKAGFAGENHPSLLFRTLIGTPKYQQVGFEVGSKQMFVGNELGDAIGLYKLHKPMSNGEVNDFPMLEKILDYIFYSLHVDPTTLSVLFSTHPLMPVDQRRRLYELFFEKYQVMKFYPALDAMLTMYSGGFTTGTVIEIGDSCTRIIPFYEGYRIDPAVRIVELGGERLTRFMRNELQRVGVKSDSSIERQLVQNLKERACFVSMDYERDEENATRYGKKYVKPDGTKIELDVARFRVPELLFKPALDYVEAPSIVEAFLDSLESCDVNTRDELLQHIFLSGGSSMFPNLETRLQHEIEVGLIQRGYQGRKVKIFAPKERHLAVWVGGSILTMIPEFTAQWVSRPNYFREGIPE